MKCPFSTFITTFLMVTYLGCTAPMTPVDFSTPAAEGILRPHSLDGPPKASAAAWAIVDGKTGDLLWHFDGLKPRKAAGATEVMNVFLALQLIEEDPSVLDEIVEVSELAGNTTGSTAQLAPGDCVKVGELLYGLMLPSGNDAGNAFAEHFGSRFAKPTPGDPEYYRELEGDTRQNFIAQMNRQAVVFGLSDTFYDSAYGDGGTNKESTTTAADLARLAWNAYKIPRFSDIVKTRNYVGTLHSVDGSSRTVTWTNTNQLLNCEGFDGVKTGATTAGYCLVSHGTRGSDSLFIAVLGSTHDDYRYIDTRNLFRWAWLQRGHRSTPEMPLDREAKDDAKERDGSTPLHIAVRNGQIEFVEVLIANGADVNARDNAQLTPIDLAAAQDRTDILQLLAKVATISSIHVAVQLGDLEKVEVFLEQGADVNRQTSDFHATPLDRAVSAGFRDIAELLIENGADCGKADKNGFTPLHTSAKQGYIDIAKLLIENGADCERMDKNGFTPLHRSAKQGHIDIVKLLIENGADCEKADKTDFTPLATSAEQGYIDIVKLLIENDADCQMVDEDGITPLHASAEQGHIDIVTLLIDKGASVNARDKWLWTPLHYACWKDHKDTTEFLISNGADCRVAGVDGDTPLHASAGQGHIDIVKLLIANGANVNSKDNNDEPPLHWAASEGHTNVVELLLAKGADVNAKNKDDSTPLDSAKDQGHTKTVELLRKRGAKE